MIKMRDVRLPEFNKNRSIIEYGVDLHDHSVRQLISWTPNMTQWTLTKSLRDDLRQLLSGI